MDGAAPFEVLTVPVDEAEATLLRLRADATDRLPVLLGAWFAAEWGEGVLDLRDPDAVIATAAELDFDLWRERFYKGHVPAGTR